MKPTGGTKALSDLGFGSTPVLVVNGHAEVVRDIRESDRTPVYDAVSPVQTTINGEAYRMEGRHRNYNYL